RKSKCSVIVISASVEPGAYLNGWRLRDHAVQRQEPVCGKLPALTGKRRSRFKMLAQAGSLSLHLPRPTERTIMAEMQNPLLDTDRLPPFAEIKPEHVEPAIDALIEEYRRTLQELLDKNEHYTWDNLIAPLEAVSDRLSKAWSPVGHM